MTERMCSADGCGNIAAKDRTLCWTHRGRRYARQCAVDGCTNQANGRMCPKHHRRLVATGTTDAPSSPPPRAWSQGNGYLVLSLPDHVLAHRGRVYEHRFVLFEAIGYGPHLCHWCDVPLSWGYTLHADHVDHDRRNNAPANLVAACQSCNNQRAGARRRLANGALAP